MHKDMGIQCTQLILVIPQCKSAHTYILLLRHYAENRVTSALELSYFERQRAKRFIKQAYRCGQ
jgi:hypothetical protein